MINLNSILKVKPQYAAYSGGNAKTLGSPLFIENSQLLSNSIERKRKALSCYQSEEIQITHSFRSRIEPTIVALTVTHSAAAPRQHFVGLITTRVNIYYNSSLW